MTESTEVEKTVEHFVSEPITPAEFFASDKLIADTIGAISLKARDFEADLETDAGRKVFARQGYLVARRSHHQRAGAL